MSERTGERVIAAAFVVAMLAGLALLVVYILGGQTQVEGVLLTLTLGGLGVGIVVWAQALLPEQERTEDRHPLSSPAVEPPEALSDEPPDAPPGVAPGDLETATRLGITRRTLLVRLMVGAFAGLAAAVAVPIFSLGPAPGRSLFQTSWRAGLHLVDAGGRRIQATDVPVGGILTVFPEGVTEIADAQTVLLHVEPGLLRLEGEAAAWAPDGFVAYSKVCTHAGCPVGLYRAPDHQLVCPCHQSAFDVLDGAKAVAGPAVRPLPQLPIRLQADGTFIALGDFPAPIGPSFWNLDLG
jgi:ubiquinol-cytochrome c reductase iron-sulfur subunit